MLCTLGDPLALVARFMSAKDWRALVLVNRELRRWLYLRVADMADRVILHSAHVMLNVVTASGKKMSGDTRLRDMDRAMQRYSDDCPRDTVAIRSYVLNVWLSERQVIRAGGNMHDAIGHRYQCPHMWILHAVRADTLPALRAKLLWVVKE
jgi:hypothetical protein